MSYRLLERDLASFFAAPFNAYGNATPYVSPMKSDLERFLDPRRNPLFARFGEGTFYSVLRGGEPVGRIVAHVHRASNERHGLRRGCFGFFDCADDPQAARMLLDAAEDWSRARNLDEIAGNFNLTAMQQVGVVTDGFAHAPYLDQVYNPPHVPALLERNGYARFFPMTTFEIELEKAGIPPPARYETYHADPRWRWRRLRLFGFKRLMEATRGVLNDGFRDNPMFVPLTPEEFRFQAGEMMWVIDQRIAPLVFDGDEPAGVIVCVPDLNPLLASCGSRFGGSFPLAWLRHWRNRRRAVIIFYAVKRAYQGKGLMGAMLHELLESLRSAGYTHLGVTWIADENVASLRQMEKLGGRALHRTHLFRKTLTA